MSDEFLYWIKIEHYPIVSWTQESPLSKKLAQYFNATSYSKWWLSMRVIKRYFLRRNMTFYSKGWLSSSKPFKYLFYEDEPDWILVDIKQAGKYFITNYNTNNLCYYFPNTISYYIFMYILYLKILRYITCCIKNIAVYNKDL